MEATQKPESMQDLFNQVQNQLGLTLKSRDAFSAKQAIGTAERVMAKIEGLILADPMVNDTHIRCVVEFTRGPLWQQARRHAATFN